VFVRSDGHRVTFEGNVSKFNRHNNLFGYTFEECITRINAILKELGLPPFDRGEPKFVRGPDGDARVMWTGARITRIDVTENFATGSPENASAFMGWLSRQQAQNVKTGTYPGNETVDWGRGSRAVYSKAYVKAQELIRKKDIESNPDLQQLAEYCRANGVIRFETTYKSTFLINSGHQYLGSINMDKLYQDYEKRQSVMTRASAECEDTTAMPAKLLAVYRMWQAGDEIASRMSQATYYRRRKELLPYGIDIAVKSNVVRFEPRVKVIRVQSMARPDWYTLPNPADIRRVA
jgi:hypothetical protein